MMKRTICGFLLLMPFIGQANLVDYTEPVSTSTTRQSAPANNTQELKRVSSQKSGLGIQYMTLSTSYESLDMTQNNEIEKYGLIHGGVFIQTGFNVYLDMSYWYALEEDGDNSKGNPKILLGFNWLRLGNPSEEMRLNLYGGGKFSTTSKLGSSRTDKIFGIESTKRLGQFGVGLAYDFTMTGDRKDGQEMEIGNIQKIAFSLGWIVSNDIQFEVVAENYTIGKGKSDNSGMGNSLNEKQTFSTLNPRLNLGLSRAVNLELGARLRMKRVSPENNLFSAKVFDLHSVHSNSIYAGLGITI